MRHIHIRRMILIMIFLMLATAPSWSGPFYMSLIIRLMILAIAASGLNLSLGIGGMASLGHAAFMGIGAYTVGISVHHGFDDGWIHLLIAIVGSAFYALISGAIALRGRGAHFMVMTVAAAQIPFFAILSMETYGGYDGLLIETRSDFVPMNFLRDDVGLYYACLLILLFVTLLIHRFVNAPFGMVARGARMNEQRMSAMGYDVYSCLLTTYVLSGVICGVSGLLLANFTHFINPDMMGWTRSADLLFMTVLGGAGSLFGPVLGAAVFVLAEHALSSIWIHWRLIFGLFLIMFIFLSRGDSILSWRSARDE